MQSGALVMTKKSILLLIVAFLAALPATYVAKDRIEVLTQSESHSAVILSCKSKASKRKKGRRRSWSYAPVAVTTSGHQAVGTKYLSDADWCRSQIGRKTTILVNPSDPKKNRINSFFQFWLFPSCILLFLTAVLLGRHYKVSTVLVLSFFVGASGAAARELGALDHVFGASKLPKHQRSRMALDFCIQNAMEREGVRYRDQLKKLNCSNFQITDISPLAEFTGLQDLRLWRNDITSLDPLWEMTDLRVLGLSRNRNLASLEGLERLTKLEKLYARNMKVADLSPLSGLKELRQLDLYGNEVSDISSLRGLDQLEEVRLSKNPVKDLGPLSDKQSLKKLTFYRSEVLDISALYGNGRLEQVGINQKKGFVDCRQVQKLRSILGPKPKNFVPRHCR